MSIAHEKPPAKSMRGITLYQVTREYECLGELLEESGGEITAEIEELWTGLADTLDDKVDNYCKLIRQFQHGADVAKAEAKRLTDLARARENAATRLKERLKQNLELLGFPKHQTALFTVRIQANSQASIRWTGAPEAIPPRYQRVVIELDTAIVREDLKADFPLPEELVVERGSHLRIS